MSCARTLRLQKNEKCRISIVTRTRTHIVQYMVQCSTPTRSNQTGSLRWRSIILATCLSKHQTITERESDGPERGRNQMDRNGAT